MKLVGRVVIHKEFGEGIIVEEKNLNGIIYFKVNFITDIKEFAFPGIFETAYMRFKDSSVQYEFQKLYTDLSINKKPDLLKQNVENITIEYNSIRPLKVIATHYSSIKNKLEFDLFTYYGGNSLDVYSACCKALKWNNDLSYNFGRQGSSLFAENATPEGYAVWFLAHSNYTDNMDNQTWINKISDDQDLIYELWNDVSKSFDRALKRVVFAKTSNGKYIFLGIYDFINKFQLKNGSRLRIFRRISKIYPISENK